MRGREQAPVVVACRPGEYERLTESVDKARHVELSALTGKEAAGYLRSQFRTSDEVDRWTPVLETLERNPDSLLAAELTTPWKLVQALTAYRAEDDPGQLLPSADVTDSDYSAHVDSMLLRRYIPAAVRLHREGTRYTGEQVQRWLTALAEGLAWQARHGRSATDITLHEWRRPPETWTAQISSAALVLFPFLVVSAIDAYVHSALVAFAVFFAAFTLNTSGAFFPRKRSQQHGSRRNERRARLEYGVSRGIERARSLDRPRTGSRTGSRPGS